MGQITLICGTGFSERSDRIDSLWREHWGNALLLTPTRRLARMRQEAYVRKNKLPGLWGNCAWELTAFAASLLESSGMRVRMVSRMDRRFMVRLILEDLQANRALMQFPCTPGLVEHLLRLITQLKQAAIEPAAFRKALLSGTNAADMDLYVTAVYEAYQAALLAESCYDVPGLYWEADNACRTGRAFIPSNASVLLLDEFDDFTPSQQRFLESLSQRVARLFIGINHTMDADQDGLFHLQHRWVETFSTHPDVEVISCATYPPKTAIHFAASSMFRQSTVTLPEGLQGNLHVVACADAQHELETIGRAVKQLIVSGQAPASAIAVALADMPQSVAMLCSVFNGFGIPFRLREMPSLVSSAVGVVFSRLFDLLDKWECQNLVALLTTPLLGEPPGEREAVMSLPLVARECGVARGRNAWSNALDALTRRLETEQTRSGSTGLPPAITPGALALFRTRFELFSGFEDSLQIESDVGCYARLCEGFLAGSGMAAACAAHPDDAAALAALRALLQEFALGAMSETPVTRKEFAVLLRDGMSETAVFVESQAGGGVFCCGIDGLRCETFSHVFLGGLNEGVLPRPAPRNALYSELDLRRLRSRGMDLSGRSEHTYRERLLFYHALRAAQKTMTLFWRKQDKTGRESLPSPFLVDLMERFGKDFGLVGPDPGPDCFVAEEMMAASPRDLVNAAAYRNNTALGGAFPDIFVPIEKRAAIERERNSTKPFSIHDGVIESPDLKARLAAAYGPEFQFSVNHLERYLAFPFNFFLDRVLRIRETGEAEGELDPMLRGVLLHEILQQFHEEYRGQSLSEVMAEDDITPRKVMANLITTAFEARRYQMRNIPVPFIRVEERRFHRALSRYLNGAGYLEDGYLPCHFETAFGRVPREEQDELSLPAPFVMDLGGTEYRFSGKIDRIDRNGDEVRLVDYKTTSFPDKKSIMSGLSLQLSLYAWAVEQHLLPGTSVREAYYLSLFKGKFREALLPDKQEEWDAREDAARQRLAEAIEGIRSGHFPPLPDEGVNLNTFSPPSSARYEGWRVARKVPDRMVPDDTDGNND